MDLVRVVGKEQCVRVFELIARAGDTLSPEHLGALDTYAAGYDAYCRLHWPQAIAHFEKALSLRPDDGPSETMLNRCRFYQQDPPPDDWECVFEPKTK